MKVAQSIDALMTELKARGFKQSLDSKGESSFSLLKKNLLVVQFAIDTDTSRLGGTAQAQSAITVKSIEPTTGECLFSKLIATDSEKESVEAELKAQQTSVLTIVDELLRAQ
jgi:hypothetical protein